MNNPGGCAATKRTAYVVAVSISAVLAAALAGADHAFPSAYASSHTATISVSSNTAAVQTALNDLASGGTVTFQTGTHTDLGLSRIEKPMTITGEPGAVISGQSAFYITSSDVTVQNLTFDRISRNPDGNPDIHRDGPVIDVSSHVPNSALSNIVISNNTISNTAGHGIRMSDYNRGTIEDLYITGNTLTNIGTFYDNDVTTNAQRAGKLMTAIRSGEDGLLRNMYISGNTIDTTTFAGINVGASAIINGHINDNSISNMESFGIQKAVERTHGGGVGKLAGPEATLSIYDNTIANTNNATSHLNGVPDAAPEAAVVIWGADDSDVHIFDNVIRENHNGVLLCVGTCGTHEDHLGVPLDIFHVADTPLNQFITVFRNSFIDNTGFDLVNLSRAQVFAPFNYWDRDPEQRISGNASYSPYYTDEARTITASVSPGQSSAHASISSCSVALGGQLDFDLVTGGESRIVAQTIRNAGSLAVDGVRVSVDAWTDANDNEYSTLTTFVKSGGQFVELAPGQYVSISSGLSAPGSSSQLEFKVVHTGRLLPTGEDSLSQTISFFGSCG